MEKPHTSLKLYLVILIFGIALVGRSQSSSIQLSSQSFGPWNILWANKPYTGLTVGQDYRLQLQVDVGAIPISMGIGGTFVTAPVDDLYAIDFTAASTTETFNLFAFALFTPFSVELDDIELLEINELVTTIPLFEYRNGYRYAFNGMEKDDEVKTGIGTSYNFEARMYDSRLGKWFSVDASQRHYAPVSPYHFSLNNPILFLDGDGNTVVGPDGNEVTYTRNENGTIEWSSNATEDIKRLGNLMLSTETGTEVWEKMECSTKNIHIEITDATDQSMNTFLDANTASGMILPGEKYNEIVDTDPKDAAFVQSDFDEHHEFNTATGESDKNQAWDDTYLIINLNVYKNTEEAQVYYGNDEDAFIIAVGSEEGLHTTQESVDMHKVKLQKDGTYKRKGLKPYEARGFENDAHKTSDKVWKEYETNKEKKEQKSNNGGTTPQNSNDSNGSNGSGSNGTNGSNGGGNAPENQNNGGG